MRNVSRTALTARIVWEILRYEWVFAARGFRGVHAGIRGPIPARAPDKALATEICNTFDAVSTIYWKRMVCLQRSLITARVLHRYGIPAEVVIGYRFAPFVGHAWVEVNGVVVNDSRGYAEKLLVLERIGPVASAA
jgi:hypothetical protein